MPRHIRRPNTGISRRDSLRVVGGGAALAAFLGAGPARRAAAAQSEPGVEGAWLVVVTQTGGPTVPLYNFFSPDGMVLNVNHNYQVRSIGIGRWIKTGDREYNNTFWWHRVNDAGALIGRTKVLTRIQLNETGDAFQGVFKGTQYDVSGNVVLTNEGTQEGTRLVAEPFV